jgi:hypothetical protein
LINRAQQENFNTAKISAASAHARLRKAAAPLIAPEHENESAFRLHSSTFSVLYPARDDLDGRVGMSFWSAEAGRGS